MTRRWWVAGLATAAIVASGAVVAGASGADRPSPDDLRTCTTRGDGGRPSLPTAGGITVGPLFIWPTVRRTAPTNNTAWPYGSKAPILVRARQRVTLQVAPEAAREVALSTSRGGFATVVRFQACREREPSRGYKGTVGRYTFFPFGFYFKTSATCLPIQVWIEGEDAPRSVVIPIGRDFC